jgi:hypothetical protein
VILRTPEEIEAVRARVEAAGVPVEPHPGGFLTRDPWDIAVAFTTEAGR